MDTLNKKELWDVLTSNRDCEDCEHRTDKNTCRKMSNPFHCDGCVRYNIRLYNDRIDITDTRRDYWEKKN